MDPDNLRPFNYPSDRYIATTERNVIGKSILGMFFRGGKVELG